MTMQPTIFSEFELDQISEYAKLLEDNMAREVKQTDTDRAIQYSTYGYVLWNYTFAHRPYPEGGSPFLVPYHVENNVRPEPCKQMVVAASKSDWVAPVESDDPEGDQSRYLENAYKKQSLGNVGCTIRISDLCTDLDETQLFMQRGEVCVYWSCCTTCHTWLSAMARAEREEVSRKENGEPDYFRKAKHILEELRAWGCPVQDLSRYMRQGDKDPVAVTLDVYAKAIPGYTFECNH